MFPPKTHQHDAHTDPGRSNASVSGTKGTAAFDAPALPASAGITLQLKSIEVGKNDKKTTVDWTEGQLKGSSDVVGTKMVAKNLHKANVDTGDLMGSPPKASAQKDLMSNLPTKPSLKTTDKYIKGHLLNHNVGGPGEAFNMFPITGSANSAHHKFVEKGVKANVRSGKHVDYTVQVEIGTDKSDNKGKKGGMVDSKFNCYAYDVTDPKNKKIIAERQVVSEYKAKAVVNDAPSKTSATHNPATSLSFSSDSLLGWLYEKVKDENDAEAVDDAVAAFGEKAKETIIEAFNDKSDTAKKMIQQMFDTKGARFTAKQQTAVKEIAQEVAYAYVVLDDKDEQKEYETDYALLVEFLKSKGK